ncbi:16S rRNA (cytidine(1402)-2'-O)-methyltransferase [Bradyrhizobium sp. HKCCYLS3077]|uniref:16S rRNA (cytidine(1402)-2'-O)-methyltransferase n=1 Tax=Bradyrhizobium sp. HKCCYLS3077 TaxID=3420761 RepID=UPI003EBE5D06
MGANAIPNTPPGDGKSSSTPTYLVAGQAVAASRARPGLHLVATPIGNLGDITLRALDTLAGADMIFCEDTRITRRLAERYGLSAELAAYHEHNAEAVRPKILQRLAEGAAIALVSDAGTPLISDPGYKLVRAACDAGHAVTALPGPSAVLAALTVAALPTDRFFFEGFLPAKQQARRTRLSELARIEATVVVFEAGSRVQDTLADLADAMKGRPAAICRELTKLHEEVLRGPVGELAAGAAELETRGEFVLVIGPPPRDAEVLTQDALDAVLRDLLQRSSVKDAVMHAVELSGRPRREVYARALELAKDTADGED